MILVIDTNALRGSNWTVETSSLLSLLITADALGHQIYIPRVVVEELVKNYSDELRAQRSNFESASKTYREMVRGNWNSPLKGRPENTDISDHRERIETLFRNYHAVILDHPVVDHSVIVDRYVLGKKPFKSEATGYKDTLIWHSLLDLSAASPDESIVFITNNVSDFASKSEKTKLHPDLATEMSSTELNPDAVSIVNSLFRFVETYIAPNLEIVVEFIGNQIIQGRKFDIEEQISMSVDTAFASNFGLWFDDYDLDPDSELNQIWFADFTGIKDGVTRSSDQVKRLSDTEFIYTSSIAFEAYLDVEVSMGSYIQDLMDGMPNFESRSVTGSISADFEARLRATGNR